MIITPDTDIYLLKVPFEMDNENELTFSNATAQFNYFNGLSKLELEGATYQRKDGILRYPGNFEDLIEYNYCMYRNNNYSNKWFYAFIEDIKFENPNMTSIKLKTDVFQTWQFDIVYKKMFVVREHVNNDTLGLHTIPENFELGEIINNQAKTQILPNKSAYALFMAVTDLPSNLSSGSSNKVLVNGIYSGLNYLVFTSNSTGITNLNNVLKMYAQAGQLDYVQSIFYSHLGAASLDLQTWSNGTISADVGIYPSTDSVYTGTTTTITRPSKIGLNYTPKNNKLFTYPYSYFTVSNNSGIAIPFHYEDFTNNNPSFKYIVSISIGGNIKLIPLNYKNLSENYESSINAGKTPVCSWVGDIYTNWLTQESVNVGLAAGSLLLGTGTALATKGAIGGEAILSGIDEIGNFLTEKIRREIVPLQIEGNINCGDLNFSYDHSGFTITYNSIKDEYAQIIDDFWSAYGYQVNSYKIPNITGRTNWNYVKTSKCNIVGNIPQKDLQEIKGIFDKGVTLWHNPNTFMDYSQSNNIV